MKKLYLVDASNMFFRAFFAIPPLTNDKGMQTNALYGFLAMTVKLVREVKPDYLVYCFDRKEPSFRADLYDEYKANRDEMPDALVPQIPYLKKLTDLLGICQVEMAKYEADDVIGSLAHLGRKAGVQVVIVSGDKDFAQLVDPSISLYDTMKDVRTDAEGVKAKFGITPKQMIDYLAIVGDSSDNVPGVKGIGPKGAEKLLNEYGDLDGVYKNIDKIKGAMQTKLIESKKMAYLSQKLVTIVTDLDLKLKLDDLKMRGIQREALSEIFQELKFQSFEKKLFSEASLASSDEKEELQAKASAAAKASKAGKRTENKADEALKGVEKAAKASAAKVKAKSLSKHAKWVEEEWTLEQLQAGVEPYSDLWAILNERGLILGIPGKVLKVAAPEVEIGEVLRGKNLKWRGFDLKEVFKALKVPNSRADWDSQLAAYVIRPAAIESFEKVYQQYCEKTLPDLATNVDILMAHLELENDLRHKLKEQEAEPVLEKLDLPLVPVLADMELKGVRIDTGFLKDQSKELAKDIKVLETAIFKEVGETFNIASPKQLGHVLFEKLKLPKGRKTKTGWSTDSDVLEGLEHPLAKMVLDYRELSKIKSTYVDAIPALVNPETERVHTHMQQAATATGRLSSINPNLQNIPIRTDRGRAVRKAFIADKGNCLISADYSQIELRILAHITEDPGLMKAFQDDLDIHTATASEVFSVKLKEVTSDMRRAAKAVNFGIAYGQGAFGLSETLGISRGEATDIIGRYFNRFAGVKNYMDDVVVTAVDRGYVETLFGRRRYLDELKSSNQNIRKFGERAAINAPIQGTASDLVKLAMIELHQSLGFPMLLQVHDELLFEVPKDDQVEVCKEVKATMESIYKLKVPLKVNVASGKNWEDAHS
jgi:DNA polymerase-1